MFEWFPPISTRGKIRGKVFLFEFLGAEFMYNRLLPFTFSSLSLFLTIDVCTTYTSAGYAKGTF